MSTLAQALEILEAFAVRLISSPNFLYSVCSLTFSIQMVLFSSTLAGFKLTTLPVASVVIFVRHWISGLRPSL